MTRSEKAKEFVIEFTKATHRIITTYRSEQAIAIIFLQEKI